MHCSNRNSKKEKKTLRSLKFNPSVDSPHICTRKLDLLSKGDRLQNRKIYSAHVYRPPHMWCRRTYTQCNTVPLYRQYIDLAEYTVLSFSGSSLVLVVAALWLGRTWKVGDENAIDLRLSHKRCTNIIIHNILVQNFFQQQPNVTYIKKIMNFTSFGK